MRAVFIKSGLTGPIIGRIIQLMSRFRTDSIGELARQMEFTPLGTRAAQVTSAEGLLHDIEANKAYPLELVIFRITGYRPKNMRGDLLTGIALQHDLGLLIEQISSTLNQRTEDLSEPVLSINEAREKFNVTSKTIQRWRRRGLAGRRLIFPDGKRRVGFLLSSIEHFLKRQGQQALIGANFLPVEEAENRQIMRSARRLADGGTCTANEIGRRLARKFNRSPLTVLQTIKKFDQANPECAILPKLPCEISREDSARIRRRFKHGMGVSALSARMGRPRNQIYRAIIDDRLSRILKKKTRFIDDPLYHQAGAADMIADLVNQQPLVDADSPISSRPLRLPNPLLQSLYREPVLTSTQERALFLKLNFHKYQFTRARRHLDERFAKHRELARIERHLRDVNETRNTILRANLRLVVSVARRHVRSGVGLMDLISDGTLILMRAIDSFDIHKGHRFSTYATFALMKDFARSVGQMLAHRAPGQDGLLEMADPAAHRPNEAMIEREQLARLMSLLAEPERAVLREHFGLGNLHEPATYRQISRRLGIPLRQVRRLEQTGLAKMRAGFETEPIS